MKLSFEVETAQDAVLARSALDGLLQAYMRREAPSEVLTANVSVADLEEAKRAWVDIAAVQQPTQMFVGYNLSDEQLKEAIPIQGYTLEQMQEAALYNDELAVHLAKKRKSEAVKARMQELTARVLAQVEAQTAGQVQAQIEAEQLNEAQIQAYVDQGAVGDALKGMTAEQLNDALKTLTEPFGTEGVGPAASIDIEARTVSQNSGAFLDFDSLGTVQEKTKAVITEEGEVLKALAETPTKAPTRDELLTQIQAYADQGAGLFWFRNVVEKGGGQLAKLTVDYMTKVLADPKAYYPG